MSTRPNPPEKKMAKVAAQKRVAKSVAGSEGVKPESSPSTGDPNVFRGPWPDPMAGPDQLARELAEWLKTNGFIPENYVCDFIRCLEEREPCRPSVTIPKYLRLQRKIGVILHGIRKPDQWLCPVDDFNWKRADRRNSLRALKLFGDGKPSTISEARRDEGTCKWRVEFDITGGTTPPVASGWTLTARVDDKDLKKYPKALEACRRWQQVATSIEKWLSDQCSNGGRGLANPNVNSSALESALDPESLHECKRRSKSVPGGGVRKGSATTA